MAYASSWHVNCHRLMVVRWQSADSSKFLLSTWFYVLSNSMAVHSLMYTCACTVCTFCSTCTCVWWTLTCSDSWFLGVANRRLTSVADWMDSKSKAKLRWQKQSPLFSWLSDKMQNQFCQLLGAVPHIPLLFLVLWVTEELVTVTYRSRFFLATCFAQGELCFCFSFLHKVILSRSHCCRGVLSTAKPFFLSSPKIRKSWQESRSTALSWRSIISIDGKALWSTCTSSLCHPNLDFKSVDR